jgi:hypothetical protein
MSAIDSRSQPLSTSFAVPEDVLSKLEQVTQAVLDGSECSHPFTRYDCNYRTFTIDSVPGYVFKTEGNSRAIFNAGNDIPIMGREIIRQWPVCLDKVRRVCEEHNLDRIVIPRARIVTVHAGGSENHPVLAVERMGVELDHTVIKEQYRDRALELDETISQVARLIILTGWSNVVINYLPLLNADPDFAGPRQVWLAGVEELDSVTTGIRRLMGFVGKRHFKVIRREVKNAPRNMFPSVMTCDMRKRGQPFGRQSFSKALKVDESERRVVLIKEANIDQFHRKKGIVTGDERFTFNRSKLNLDWDKQGEYPVDTLVDGKRAKEKKTMTMREFSEFVEEEMQKAIQTSRFRGMKERRRVTLRTSREPYREVRNLGVPYEQQDELSADLSKLWIEELAAELLRTGQIHSYETEGAYGPAIQV